MAEHIKDIPRRAFISAQIIQHALQSGALEESTRLYEGHYRLSHGSLSVTGPAHLVSLLYCLVVVPKEIWILSENHHIYKSIDAEWLLRLFKIDTAEERFNENIQYYIIYHLRNAIAHANFSVDDDGSFTFWDKKRKNAQPFFRATISIIGLEEFLSVVGSKLSNLRSN